MVYSMFPTNFWFLVLSIHPRKTDRLSGRTGMRTEASVTHSTTHYWLRNTRQAGDWGGKIGRRRKEMVERKMKSSYNWITFRHGLGTGGRMKPKSKEQRWRWHERHGIESSDGVGAVGKALPWKPGWITSSLGLPC